MSFVDGERRGKLDVVGKVAKSTTGTTVRFWPRRCPGGGTTIAKLSSGSVIRTWPRRSGFSAVGGDP